MYQLQGLDVFRGVAGRIPSGVAHWAEYVEGNMVVQVRPASTQACSMGQRTRSERRFVIFELVNDRLEEFLWYLGQRCWLGQSGKFNHHLSDLEIV